jgi:hypothetical protein
MNIKDEQFKNFINYTDNSRPHFDPAKVAKYFAGILADIAKRKASSADIALWASVPQIGADAQRMDIVKDFSIRRHDIGWHNDADLGGQVGIVTDVREIRKRDGRTAVEVEIVFYNHTNRDYPRRRKLQFIKGEQIDTSVPAYLTKG